MRNDKKKNQKNCQEKTEKQNTDFNSVQLKSNPLRVLLTPFIRRNNRNCSIFLRAVFIVAYSRWNWKPSWFHFGLDFLSIKSQRPVSWCMCWGRRDSIGPFWTMHFFVLFWKTHIFFPIFHDSISDSLHCFKSYGQRCNLRAHWICALFNAQRFG